MILLAALAAFGFPPYVPPELPCFRQVQVGSGLANQYIGDRACLRLEPPRVFEGIWIDEYEGSRFYEGAADLHNLTRGGLYIRLSIDNQSVAPPALRGRGTQHVFRVRFVGQTGHDVRPDRPATRVNGTIVLNELLEFTDLGLLERDQTPRRGTIYTGHWERP